MQQTVDVEIETATLLAQDLRASCLGVRIGRLNRIVGRRFEGALRPLDLSMAQMEILGCLVLVAEPVRPVDLAEWLAIERSTMSRNLALMERRGYIEPTESSPTGRSQRVTVTTTGREALAHADDAWRQVQTEVAHELGDDAVPIIDRWLNTLTTSVNDGDPVARKQ